MKLSLISFLAGFAAPALAAECSGDSTNGMPSELLHLFWDARNQMCSNSNCGLGQDCNVQVTGNFNNKVVSVILMRRKNGVKGFKDCYDATNNIINQCVYSEHKFNGKWVYGGQTYSLVAGMADSTPPPPGCNVAKYCAYTYRNDNCRITTWKTDGNVPNFFECRNSAGCPNGGQCINNLCCHADKLSQGAAMCPTVSDLQKCGGFQRIPGGVGQAAWSPPRTDIPGGLKCGC
ncbi:hypothetical protein NQ176_g5276 [Zarea fungicola]|uniref:Uncharacterized protein n=1 Tax=Zarea fungicola TaxID=93591 RepID=A0ACC1NB66_9HYPO|nr:hypothetical protein NQ176_g5276 [Lecanicillium fungicola]